MVVGAWRACTAHAAAAQARHGIVGKLVLQFSQTLHSQQELADGSTESSLPT